MSNRKTILDALIGGPATREELADACPSLPGRKLLDTLGDCKKVGLIKLEKDVTGLPAYRLTPAGQGWLRANPGAAKPQPGVGKKTPAVSASQPIVDGGKHDADSAPMAGTVVEQLPQDDSLAVAGSDVPAPEYDPREVGFDAVKRADALRERAEAAEEEAGNLRFILGMIEKALNPDPDEGFVPAIQRLRDRAEKAEADLESICSANRKFCGYVAELVGNTQYPVNLYECQNIIDELVNDALEAISAKSDQLNGYMALADMYGIGDTLNDLACYIAGLKTRIASLEGNASLPLEIASKTESTAVVKEFLTTQPDHFVETNDMVNHPPHYQGKVECIDAIESALGPDGFAAYCRGNAIKYTFRAGSKGDAKLDLAKAGWYLGRLSA